MTRASVTIGSISIFLTTEEICFRLWQMHGAQLRYVCIFCPLIFAQWAKSTPSKPTGTTIDIYWTWDWWHLDTSGKPIQCIFTVIVSEILNAGYPLQ
jgi:hypothetical protein